MADPRFFDRAGPFSLAELASVAGATLSDGADPDQSLDDVATLDAAGPQQISFLDNRRYLSSFTESKAGACLVEARYAERAPAGMALLITDKPHSGYARVAQAFYPENKPKGAIHPTALVDESATVGKGVSLGAYAVIGPGVELADGCSIGPQVVIEAGVKIGAGTTIGPGCFLTHCLVGRDCQIHSGVRIGNRGFGFAMDPEGYIDVPQLGRVIIEDNVELGANATVDRGAGPDTVLGAGSKIDNLVQIGHNVQIGRGCVLVSQSGIAGSAKLGNHVVVAAQSGVAGHITLGDGAQVAAKSGVMRDVPAGQTVGGTPAMPLREFFKLVTYWQRQLKTQGKNDG